MKGNGGGNNVSMGGPRKAAPPRPQQGTVTENSSADTPKRHTSGNNSAGTEHGALAQSEYGLLAPTGTVVDPADVGEPESEAGHGATG